MSIDWSAILDSAVKAGSSAVSQNAPQIEDFLREVAAGHESALVSIGQAFAVGDIDEATFESELGDEGETLKAELQVVAVLTKAIAQRAANAFIDAILKGVTAAVAAVL